MKIAEEIIYRWVNNVKGNNGLVEKHLSIRTLFYTRLKHVNRRVYAGENPKIVPHLHIIQYHGAAALIKREDTQITHEGNNRWLKRSDPIWQLKE